MDQKLFYQRREAKFLLTKEQQTQLLQVMSKHMAKDKYFHSSIRNLYLDTPDHLLIRRSMERPIYKEKFRIRSYGRAEENDQVFVEQKKKYKHIVYKRRITMPQSEALKCVEGESVFPDGQIGAELDYAVGFYRDLHPSIFISYERDAYTGINDDGIRITFDYDIRYRQEDLTLDSEPHGIPILNDDQVLMEVKVPEGFPLWLTSALSKLGVYKSSFSKYAMAYSDICKREGE